MKLLFDHNLPPSLVRRLANLFPLSAHVFSLGLDRASDLEIREFAHGEGFIIVTKDADFSDDLEQLLSKQFEQIEALNADPSIGVLTLF